MAIGKIGGFATVQAPNVDFGDIALNAQKFQEADLERKKALKEAQLKAEKEKQYKQGKEAPTYTANTSLKGVNEVFTDFFHKSMTELQILNNKEANEGLTAQEVAKQIQLRGSGQQGSDFVKSLATAMKEDNELINTSSEISNSSIDLYQKALKGKGLDRFEMTPDGDMVAYFYKTKEDPITKEISLDLDADGKPQSLTREDGNGNVIPSILSYKDVVYGDFKQRIVQPTNENKLVEEIVKGTGYNTFGTDTGVVKDVSKNVTSTGLATMKLNIKENLLKNNNSTLDILSRMAKTNTYKELLKDYKYNDLRKVTDKELDLVTEYINNLAISKLDTSNVKNVNLSEGYKAQDRENRFTFVPTTDVQRIGELKMPSGKFNEMPSTVAKTSYGLGENVKFKQLGGSKTGLVAGTIPTLSYDMESGNIIMGVKTLDTKGKRYKMQSGEMVDFIKAQQMIDQLSSDGQQTLQADLNGYGTADSYKYDVRTPGAEAKAIIANSMGKSWNQIQGEIIKANKQEIDEYRRSKGKNQQTNTQSNKQISSEEFNSKWSKLKSGEKLVGPDGKTYTKS